MNYFGADREKHLHATIKSCIFAPEKKYKITLTNKEI